MKCGARQYNDQMYCSVCQLTWDVDDISSPECKPATTSQPAPIKPSQWNALKQALRTNDFSDFKQT